MGRVYLRVHILWMLEHRGLDERVSAVRYDRIFLTWSPKLSQRSAVATAMVVNMASEDKMADKRYIAATI